MATITSPPALGQEIVTDPASVRDNLYLTKRRIPELDGLRGLAILLVLICHYVINILKVEPGTLLYYARGLLSMTWSGVDLFFVLSGFLIGGILIDVRSSETYFKTFYIRRFLRIFPIYYVSLALLAVTIKFASGIPALNWLIGDPLPLAAYATFTQNIVMSIIGGWGPNWANVTWSLAIEEQFYIFLPLLIRFTPPRHLIKVVALGVVSAPVVRLVLLALDANVAYSGYALMPCRADSLGLGVLAAILLRKPEIVREVVQRRKLVTACLLLFALGMLGLTASRSGPATFTLNSIGYSWIAVFYLLVLVYALCWPDGWMGALLRCRPLVYLGTVSYFVYLFHQPVSGFTHYILFGAAPAIVGWQGAAASAAALAITLLCASVSWKYFERPLVQRGQLYKY